MTRRALFWVATALAAMPQVLAAARIYDYDLQTIDYHKLHVSDFKGRVLMIVNAASRYGYTPQYAGLQQLYVRYKDQGFVVIGIPSDDFGQGEPGSNPEIKQFCRRKYDVTFPMMSKSLINLNPRLPIYQYPTDQEQNPKSGGLWAAKTRYIREINAIAVRRFRGVKRVPAVLEDDHRPRERRFRLCQLLRCSSSQSHSTGRREPVPTQAAGVISGTRE